ncbi:hypothetical protein [Corynebacterium sp.]|uniref:hypothetical protein n=1 Tax=Corynebacterium sp. TaxID=1720 RepID=UPI003736D707
MERANSDDEEESTLGWALLPEVMEDAGPVDEGLAAVVKEYVDSQALDYVETRSEVRTMATNKESGKKDRPDKAAYEAERKRRMAKLRRTSARRTLEVIERKFPNLTRTAQ